MARREYPTFLGDAPTAAAEIERLRAWSETLETVILRYFDNSAAEHAALVKIVDFLRAKRETQPWPSPETGDRSVSA